MLRLFYRLILRPLKREPRRTLVTVLAVALGVAVMVAIELAGEAAAGSFRSSVETLTGKADFEVTAAGGVPDHVAAALAALPYDLRMEVRLEDHATILASRRSVPLIGLDLVGGAVEGFQQQDGTIESLDDPDGIWASKRLGFHVGERVRLRLNDRAAAYTVKGVLEGKGDASQAEVLVMDIAAAQQALGKTGRLDRILIDVPEDPPLEEWRARLARAMPPGVTLQPQGSRSGGTRRMLEAFRWNLRVLSYIALVVGAFLIYNTISVSVVRRRADIGILRALGATRGAVLLAFLGEAACLAAVGAVLGVLLGRLLASAAVLLLAATVESLYVSSTPAPVTLTPLTALIGTLTGITVALVSALGPAREAAQVAPVEAMARGRVEYTARVRMRWNMVLGALLSVAGLLAARVPAVEGKPLFGYVAALLFIGASACVAPALVTAVCSVSARLLPRFLGVESLLASRSLAASLRRTSVLVGALSTSVAMMTAVGLMVGSFRQTVLVWMDNQLIADLYLRPRGASGADLHPTMSAGIAERIARLPGVAAVDRFRAYEITYRGLPATLASADTGVSARFGKAVFFSGKGGREVLPSLAGRDTVLVSEPFANKHGVRTGDTIRLPLGLRAVDFRVADIYYDYANERGYILMDRSTMLRYLPDEAPSNVAVYLRRGISAKSVRASVEAAAGPGDVLVMANRELRRQAIRIFDRTFVITYALEAVAVLVAVMGAAGALVALVVDRRREFGLLRFLGASQSQVRRLVMIEAGLLGLLANIAGLALGLVLALLLIFVINKQSFGWTIQFHWPVGVLLAALSVVFAATLAAGLYPSRIATRLSPIDAVHEE